MPLVKKVSSDWNPSEYKGVKVGDVVDFNADYKELVKKGMIVLVDEVGNEIEVPNTPIQCPICFKQFYGILTFLDHINSHSKIKEIPAPKETVSPEVSPAPVQVATDAVLVKSEEVLPSLPTPFEVEEEVMSKSKAKRVEAQKKRKAKKAAKKK